MTKNKKSINGTTDEELKNYCIGFRVKYYRIKYKLSVTEMAKLLDCSVYTIRKWEIGMNEPSLKSAFKLHKIFRTPMELFINDRYKLSYK